MTTINLKNKTARAKLAVRNEPHWISLSKGRSIGFRKTASGGTWYAKNISETGKRTKTTLGIAESALLPDELNYAGALKEANVWFESVNISAGTANKKATVSVALDKYILNRAAKGKNGQKTADAIEYRINKYIRPVLGDILLSKLSANDLEEWQLGLLPNTDDEEKLRAAKDTANRHATALLAVLKHAYKFNLVSSDTAWKSFEKFKDVAKSRDLFLSIDQCLDLIAASEEPLKALVTAGVLTGCRFGELASATVGNFDSTGFLTVTGKTGTRKVHLTNEGVELIAGLTQGKRADDLLFTNKRGNAWPPVSQNDSIKRAAKIAGLPDGINFYTLRHSYISIALKNGINIHLLAKNCGNSAAIIEKNYAKFMDDDVHTAVNTYAPALNPKIVKVVPFKKTG